MSDDIAGQIAKLVTTIAQTGVPASQLRHMSEGGYFADLCRADFTRMSRDEFRTLCHVPLSADQPIRVMADYSASFEQLVVRGRYDFFNPAITAERFPIPQGRTVELTEIELIEFKNRFVTRDKVIDYLTSTGRRLTNIVEHLAIGSQHPRLQMRKHIVSGCFYDAGGIFLVPTLFGYPDHRRCGIHENGMWFESKDYVFAAVRKEPQGAFLPNVNDYDTR